MWLVEKYGVEGFKEGRSSPTTGVSPWRTSSPSRRGTSRGGMFSGFWPSMGPVSVGLVMMWDGRRLGGGGTRHPWHGGIEIVAACSEEAGNDRGRVK